MNTPDELKQITNDWLAENDPRRKRKAMSRQIGIAKNQARRLAQLQAAKAVLTPPKPTPSSSHVYVIGAGGHPVKIGIAGDVTKRLAGLQTASPTRLRCYFQVHVGAEHARAIEQECHRLLAGRRLSGEWFDLTPLEAIEAVQGAIDRRSLP